MDELNFQERNYLDILSNRLKEQHEAFTKLDEKAQNLVSLGSIILGLVVALNLDNSRDLELENKLFLFLAAISFAIAYFVLHLSISPKDFAYPIETTWDTARKALGMSPSDYYVWLLTSYDDALSANRRVLKLKAAILTKISLLVGCTILLTIAAAAA